MGARNEDATNHDQKKRESPRRKGSIGRHLQLDDGAARLPILLSMRHMSCFSGSAAHSEPNPASDTPEGLRTRSTILLLLGSMPRITFPPLPDGARPRRSP